VGSILKDSKDNKDSKDENGGCERLAGGFPSPSLVSLMFWLSLSWVAAGVRAHGTAK
jgi:hypothetical protein